MTKRSAIILAGGYATRFQTENQSWQDKALACVNGKPLLVHTVSNVQSVADEVVVCVNDKQRKSRYSQVLLEHNVEDVEFVVDKENSAASGPLLAITSGLNAVSASYCLTVPVDMPFLKPEVAEYMFKSAQGFDVAVPMWPDGTLETLLMALKSEVAVEIAETLLVANKTRADSIPRGAGKLQLLSPLNEIKTLDPELRSFININVPQDLTQLKTRSTTGKVRENLCFDFGELLISKLRLLRGGEKKAMESKFLEAQKIFSECTRDFEGKGMHFWAGLGAEKLAQSSLKRNREQSTSKTKEAYLQAARNYQAEAEIYAAKDCRLLSERAEVDKTQCQSQTNF